MAFKIVKSFVVIGVLILATVTFAKTGEIIIPSAIEISPRDVITAYDIVESRNVDKDILEDLKNVSLAGKTTRIITRIELIQKLRGLSSTAKFIFPTEVKLLRSGQNISRMELERKIKNHLLANCMKCDFKISINSVPKALNSDWELDLNIDLNKKSVMIPVYSLSEPQSKGWITAEIRKYMNVATLNRDIKVGEVVNADMINMEYRLVDQTDLVNDVEKIVGMQTVRFLSAGKNLSYRDFKKESVLKKGQLVKAIFGKNDFEVSISAQAEEGGVIGDVVKVKNLDSQKVFAAKIEDRGVVRIE